MAQTFPHLPVTDLHDATRNFEALQARLLGLTTGEGVTDSGWLAPELEHGFAQEGAAIVGYRKIASVVRLRGRLGGGETEKAGFTLPEGFRPPQQFYQGVIQSGVTMGYVVIETTGEVILGLAGLETPSLDAVTFTTD